MNPFISFCLYVAARVFVQFLKSRPGNGQAEASLQFLLSAMTALKRKNPLTESFLVQLDVDLEGLGFRNPKHRREPGTFHDKLVVCQLPPCADRNLLLTCNFCDSQARVDVARC